MQRRRILALCAISLGVAPALSAQCAGDERAILAPSDGGTLGSFGRSVAICGDLIVTGAPSDNDFGQHSGSAYVYTLEGDDWIEQKLLPADPRAEQFFGRDVDVDAEWMVIGADGDDDLGDSAGAVYVFRHDGSDWVEEQKLLASDGAAGDRFGTAVGISGSRIAVGAPYDQDRGERTGAAYVFEHDGTSWIQTQKLLPSDATMHRLYGENLALDGDTLALGVADDSDLGGGSGAAYVFEVERGFWSQTKLYASDAQSNTQLGISVGLRGDLLAVGAESDELGNASGSVYVFRRQDGLWTEEQKLLPPGQNRGGFATEVAVDTDHILASIPFDDQIAQDAGAAFVARHDGSRWLPFETCLHFQGEQSDFFGYSADLDQGRMAVGAPGDGNGNGSVRVFAYDALALEITPTRPVAGESLLFETCGALAGSPMILFTIEVDGNPFFFKPAFGVIGPDGAWTAHTTVPPGLAGLRVVFQSLSFSRPGRLGLSTGRLVRFQ